MSMQHAAGAAEERRVGPWVPEWSFADRLRKVRREVNLTQREFAQNLSVPEPRYAAWESDRATPSNVVTIAKAIQLATGVPAGWLLGVDAPPTAPVTSAAAESTDNSGAVLHLPQREHTTDDVEHESGVAPVVQLRTAVAR